jgi:hypothetical protein
VMCQADLDKIIFWLRNPPVIGGVRHGRDVVMFLLVASDGTKKNETERNGCCLDSGWILDVFSFHLSAN